MAVTNVAFEGDALGHYRPDVQTALEQMWEKLQQLTTDINALGANLPVEDPQVVGALWNNSGVITVSAGEV